MKKKPLITFFSWTGNNKEIAKLLHGELDCDVMEIREANVTRVGMWGYIVNGMRAALKMPVKIEPVKKNPMDYGLIILVTPLWVGTLPPATRTFLSENKEKFKRIALLSISGTGIANEKAVGEIETLLGKKLSPYLLLNEEEFKEGTYKEKFENFVKAVRKKE